MKINIGFVVSEFNANVTMKMLERAKKHAKSLGVDVRYICYVPGTFDMPLMVANLLQKKDVDGVVTLGAIIKGETRHDEVIAHSTARSITELSLLYKKPVSLGISGPGMNRAQAEDRVNTVSVRAVTAAVEMIKRIRQLRTKTKNKVIR
ncbi:MAG: 6,7-dimethyl-8-ribityllumazine synthase [Nitrososphaerales archaeon]